MTTTAEAPTQTASSVEVDRAYRYYQPRILIWSIFGYAMYYFVRKNLSVAMPVIEEQLHISKSSLGLFLTLHGLLYGLSKFINGMIGDRVNARIFMAIGLVCSAGMNIAFGFSSAVLTLGMFWMLNGWFQGIGFPPCARLMTHWFSPKELATKMSIWNISHGLGAGAVVILCGYLVTRYHDWRLCFFVPAGLAIVSALLLSVFLRDTPESVGLPPVEGTQNETETAIPGDPPESFRSILFSKVFSNPYIWIFALANFFVYTVRYAVLDWGPTLLKEFKGLSLLHGGWMVAGFEVAGLAGTLTAGYLTDRIFRGRGARTCVFCMLFCAAAVFLFWRAPAGNIALNTVLLMAAGFFVYGPQALVGISVANLATKKAAATAVGLTGIFGYASGILSGWGLGLLVQNYGWSVAFEALLGVAIIGVVLFALAWRAPRDGYAEKPKAQGFEPVMKS